MGLNSTSNIFCSRITPLKKAKRSSFILLYGHNPTLLCDVGNLRGMKRSEREDRGAEYIIRGIDHMSKTFQETAVHQRNREIKPGNSESDLQKQFNVGG